MSTITTLRKWALSLPEVTEEPHFEKTFFRIRKKIFATYDEHTGRASLKLNAIDQDVYSAVNKTSIYPVDNKWGSQGWTIFELAEIQDDLMEEALKAAYVTVAPKTLATRVRTNAAGQ